MLSPPNDLYAVRMLLADLPAADDAAARAAAERERCLLKPPGALGRLEAIVPWLSSWQHRHPPRLARIGVRIFAGNHGVAAAGVSAYPPSVTAQMVASFAAGGAAINQLCHLAGADLAVRPLDLEQPTRNFLEGPALDEAAFLAALRAGFEAVDAEMDLLCLGEMGIGNTTAAAAVSMALFGDDAAAWTGPGTGVAGEALARKAAVVAAAVARHRAATADPLDLLRRLGGREMAAIAGAVIAARHARIPVILDGYVTTAAAAPLFSLRGDALDHCLVGHGSAEPGHGRLLAALGKRPLLDLGLRLGEASGAVLAVGIVRAAVACHTGMATFAEANVDGPSGAIAQK